MITIADLPVVNASLNGTSALLLTCGFVFIRRRLIRWHRACMIAALTTSTLFLVSYLTYHFHVGNVHFRHFGWIRPLYFSILISHTILAVAIVPLALITLSRALREKFDKHKQIAHWTLPIWLYVSVTGVTIYWMLYRM
ncbi:MAG: DUF420 domain-containing protein [Acidobacteriia bacterium]|nr:DUF420 domain-containing protein [Terriglobia bacterium]